MIYLDHAATTPCAEEVVQAMLPYFREQFANASSIDHVLGSRAREAVEQAREKVALLVGAQPEDVIFTSGATEANNLGFVCSAPGTDDEGGTSFGAGRNSRTSQSHGFLR